MFTDICNAINNSKNILIIPHTSADGDCLGSSYALKLLLEELGKLQERAFCARPCNCR